ncbi:MAG: hypothetical protein COX39_02970 [Candidatus Nealsonbacteria bacterium CG23_combo_of_CG06-09_8_20_14_all_40_13]|uniref:DOD-type homing endonuclease domain-containing protein n=1 Tax=Candidatus Nealsonbacteria bacterium CG23_combo_of_CG06-09_8_20_14_all_40_13 TaxID=1974724 RepID=A0A2G9YQE9_9BACT|nr:MAG: hypothetical protein COX39_02970 [Candidatus Nealsonbacteria bacterium CG23_combo_of_CG06-09_8_20_14_all_40_13]PIR70873.1 MAG: hypothetical protein COU44_02660 [Candidatus Nealsonbacteria bacterium CG10_big_fil_rev_8_21_14_0_10_40_24]PIU43130.1 MAG: hypothetical protein COS97_02645 [Candidatus Nealsonbacteria bacterium CG07_land_8_20_14_0_80_40_10]
MRKYQISKTFIIDRYFIKNLSQDLIAKELKISQWVISHRMRQYGLKAKDKTRKLGQRKYHVNENYFDQINSENAWVLGWLVSDGFVRGNDKSPRFGIKVSIKDKDVLQKIRKLLFYTGKLIKMKTQLKKTRKTYFQIALLITSAKLVRRIEEIGIKTNKSTKENFPEILKRDNDEQIIKSFILGVFEGDGSILWDKKKRSLLFQIVGSKGLLSNIQKFLIRYLNLNRTKLTRNIKKSNHFALRYRGNKQALRIFDWLYLNAQYYLNRKHNFYLAIRKELI